MLVVPVLYKIPPDVYAKLELGEWMRFGSVVRNGTEIVMHLEEIKLGDVPKHVAEQVVAAAKGNPKTVAGIGLGVTIAVAAAAGLQWRSKSKRSKADSTEVPAVVGEMGAALDGYLRGIQTGSGDRPVIDRLAAALQAVVNDVESGDVTVTVHADQLEALIKVVDGYSAALCEANGLAHIDEDRDDSTGSIVDLRRRLRVQQQLFNEAA